MPNTHRTSTRRMTRRYGLTLLWLGSIHRAKEKGIAAPTINRNKGMIRSSPVKPSHSAWLNCALSTAYNGLANRAVRSNTKSWPPMIQNMSKPRRASIDLTRPPAGVVSLGLDMKLPSRSGYRPAFFIWQPNTGIVSILARPRRGARNGTVPFDNTNHSIMAPAEVYTQTQEPR